MPNKTKLGDPNVFIASFAPISINGGSATVTTVHEDGTRTVIHAGKSVAQSTTKIRKHIHHHAPKVAHPVAPLPPTEIATVAEPTVRIRNYGSYSAVASKPGETVKVVNHFLQLGEEPNFDAGSIPRGELKLKTDEINVKYNYFRDGKFIGSANRVEKMKKQSGSSSEFSSDSSIDSNVFDSDSDVEKKMRIKT